MTKGRALFFRTLVEHLTHFPPDRDTDHGIRTDRDRLGSRVDGPPP
jgi:hypothetical protein